MKETIFKCERKGCNYTKTVIKKGRLPTGIFWPHEFTPIKTDGHKYHLCPDCTQQHNDLQKEVRDYYLNRFRLFIQGKNYHTRQP